MADSCIGWLKLYRALRESSLWLDKPFARGQAWIDLLLRANPYDKDRVKWERGIQIIEKKGEFSCSIAELSRAWGWSRTKTGKFIEDLEEENQIMPQKRHQNIKLSAVFSIVNWEYYQSKEHQKEHQIEQQKSIKKTSDLAVNKEYIYNTNTESSLLLRSTRNSTPPRAHVRGEISLTNSEPVRDIYKAAYEYLNARLDKRFPHTDTLVRSLINRWTKESDPCYTLDDLKKAVDNCRAAWLGDSKMCNNLRPSVIWGHKFPEYLNMVVKAPKKKGTGYDVDKHNPSRSTDPNYWLTDDREFSDNNEGHDAFTI